MRAIESVTESLGILKDYPCGEFGPTAPAEGAYVLPSERRVAPPGQSASTFDQIDIMACMTRDIPSLRALEEGLPERGDLTSSERRALEAIVRHRIGGLRKAQEILGRPVPA